MRWIRIRDIDFFSFLRSRSHQTKIEKCRMLVNITDDEMVKESLEFEKLSKFIETKRGVTHELKSNDCFQKKHGG